MQRACNAPGCTPAPPAPLSTPPLPPARLSRWRSTPIIMHMGPVAHQHAKWQPPPDKWACTPEMVGLSPSGEASLRHRAAPCRAALGPAAAPLLAGLQP